MNDIYLKELKKAMNAPASRTGKSREDIQAAIETITDLLKTHLSNPDRLNLVQDRAALRRELEALTFATKQ